MSQTKQTLMPEDIKAIRDAVHDIVNDAMVAFAKTTSDLIESHLEPIRKDIKEIRTDILDIREDIQEIKQDIRIMKSDTQNFKIFINTEHFNLTKRVSKLEEKE